jgi:Flp pilus assembly protein TadG
MLPAVNGEANMLGWIRSCAGFCSEQSGNVAILFALSALPVFGITGLSIDYGRAINARTQLQLAADAAALSAASRPNLTDSERIDLAKAVFRADRLGDQATISVEATVAHSGSGAERSIRVTAATNVPNAFGGVVGFNQFSLSVEATAQLGAMGSAAASGPACLLALRATDYGIKINGGGSGSHLTANCGVYVNSGSSRAIFGNDKGTLTSTYTCVVGDFDDDPTYAPMPTKGCPTMADPFAGRLTAPASAGCTFNNTKVNSNKTATLSPGVHCGGIDIGSGATVTFNPGVYVIKDGQFKIGSSAKATGNGVFFYLVGNNTRFLWTSHAEVDFKAPASGTWKGMLLWSDNALSNAHEFGCHSESIVQGAIYSPGTEIQISSWGDVGASADWTVWVVKSIEMASHAHLRVMASYTGSATPMPDGLAERLTYTPRMAHLK